MSDIFNPEVDDLRTTALARPTPTAAVPVSSPSAGAVAFGGSSTKDVAADEARGVADDAQASGRQVAETAKQQAGDVVDEARTQARELFAQAKDELTGHAADQHRRAAAGLHALADELHGMVQGSPQDGIATDLTRQVAGHVSALAGWFDGHEPGDALEELRGLARRRPGAFLAGAAALGVIGGRLTRAGIDEAADDSPQSSRSAGSSDAATPAYNAGLGTAGTGSEPAARFAGRSVGADPTRAIGRDQGATS